MKAFSQRRPFIYCLSVALVVVVLLDVACFGAVWLFPDLDSIALIAISSAAQLVLSISVILLARNICVAKGWFKVNGTLNGLLMGWLPILYAVVMILVTAINMPSEYWVVPKPWPLFVLVAVAFTTGLLEEVLVRGLVLNVLLNKSGITRKEILRACWISSILFGLLHLSNFTTGAGVVETVGQIIYATFVGMLLAAIYLRTKSLWPPIILHAVIDLPDTIFGAFVSSQTIEEIAQMQAAQSIEEIIMSTLIKVALSTLGLIIAFILLRKPHVQTNRIFTFKGRSQLL